MKLARISLAFVTFLLISALVLVVPAVFLHFEIAGWNPIYIPHTVFYGTLFAAGWPSWLATAITLTAVFLALRSAGRATQMHARGMAVGIGGHPVLQVFGSGMMLLALYAALGGAALATEWMALVILFGIATIIGFFLLGIYGGLLVAAAINARAHFRPAVEAVERGFKPSMIARDVTANGICMLDEQQRKIFVGGRTCDFDEVSSIESEIKNDRPSIRVALRSGDTPVKLIGYQSTSQRDQDFQRLGNALGMA